MKLDVTRDINTLMYVEYPEHTNYGQYNLL